MSRNFADISNNNGPHMNFEAYRQERHILIGMKASEGLAFHDPYHADWAHRAHHKGKLHIIHYHFAHVDGSAIAQAEFFWNCIKDHFGPNDFACIDIEDGGLRGSSAQHAAVWTNTFANQLLRESTHHAIGYSNEAKLKELVTAGVRILGDRWWIAAYGSKEPKVGGVKTWAWQYSDGVDGPGPHEAAGIGQCDMSRLNWGTQLRLRFSKVI